MFEGFTVGDWTAGSLLAVAILLLLFGRLIPRPTYEEKAKEAERWRLAYEAERTARMTSDAQTAELLELAKATHDIMAAVFNSPDPSTGRHRLSGGPHVVPTAR